MMTLPFYKSAALYKSVPLFKSAARSRSLIQYTSGLYLDMYTTMSPGSYVRPVAPILALAGDIGAAKSLHTRDFLKYCNKNWDATLYVPGTYEHIHDIANTVAICADLPNVHLLMQDTYVSDKLNTVFIGAQLKKKGRDDDDRVWLRSEFLKWRDSDYKIVALTNGSPIKKGTDDVTPSVNAWICSHSEGAAQMKFDNGSILAYNSRGAYYYHAMNNWTRRAIMDVPENDELLEDMGGLL